MEVILKPITCNNIVLATTTFVPETFYEKLIGLRGQKIVCGLGMIFKVSNSLLDSFDTFFCNCIGWIAMNKEKIVIQKGIMLPNKIKFIRCEYWFEIHPLLISSVKIGDIVHGLLV